MIVQLSISHDLSRWLGMDLPRLMRRGSDVIGAQRIANTEDVVSWQCHLITSSQSHSPYHTVVAVQPVSHYALLIPYLHRPTQDQFAGDLIYRWGNELMHRMVDTRAIQQSDVVTVAEQFKTSPRSIEWYLNSDQDLLERASSTEQWIDGYLDAFELNYLEEDHAIDVGAHINSQSGTKDGMQDDDSAVVGFVNDGLYRFANGLCTRLFKNTIEGNYPYPWTEAPPCEVIQEPVEEGGAELFSIDHLSTK